MPTTLMADYSIPLYEQLKNIMKEDILGGVYRTGDRMPSEAELGQRYGVSRITVRRAVQELSKEGMLECRQGKGTFVIFEKYQNQMDTITGYTDAMLQAGHKPRRIIHSKKIIGAPEFVSRDLLLEPHAPVIELIRTMFDEDAPLLFDQCYYPLERFPDMLERFAEDVSTYQLMKEVYGVSLPRARKRFHVEIADEATAKYLMCAPGDPLFSIYKITYDKKDLPVQISHSLVLASRASYVIDVDERKTNHEMHLEFADPGDSQSVPRLTP